MPGRSPPVVLVVDDELMVLGAMRAELEQRGWRVLAAASGERALQFLAAGEQVDAVVTDIQLGGQVDGWDVAAAYRRADPDVAIVYVSGRNLDSARRLKPSACFTKPYSFEEVASACKDLVCGRAS
jgi:CheY-like chemotaxis protein